MAPLNRASSHSSQGKVPVGRPSRLSPHWYTYQYIEPNEVLADQNYSRPSMHSTKLSHELLFDEDGGVWSPIVKHNVSGFLTCFSCLWTLQVLFWVGLQCIRSLYVDPPANCSAADPEWITSALRVVTVERLVFFCAGKTKKSVDQAGLLSLNHDNLARYDFTLY